MHTKHIGGQAVNEGVMMESPSGWSVAVRNPKGDIEHKTVTTRKLPRFLRLPVLRGVVALFHALFIGIKAIEYSGNVAYQEEEKSLSTWSMGSSIVIAVLLAIALFIVLPLYVTKLMGGVVEVVSRSSFAFNLVDGILRVIVFLIYVFAVGLWKEMRRIYEYHGAEHKVIYAYEAGEDLTVESAKKHKPYHPRCGTSFLLIVMVTSIIVFTFIPKEWSFAWKAASRLILIPAIAGISYEILRSSAKLQNQAWSRIVAAPGLLLQRMTVREPDNSQIEVALSALQEVLKLEAMSAEVTREC